ncbi:hypothetical protein ATO10_02895 [Actibacterium atlanticum]|uniref:Pvc16 N-terminal domain-containing protein n=1 Tax=Actibacterium atlanticum TaxID=1461693 RepID=A0A058ZQ43_9RHOB|nr:DUF4255 domain-containing protein [Actibacterium atlanticum]KCV83673.1 hypothetical protein ATO10_02895 [Actibacterium atlanticum]
MTAMAIAAVTATLKQRLHSTLDPIFSAALGTFSMTSKPLDTAIGETDKNQLNLYLWKVARNPAFENERLPAHSGAGGRVDHPRLALNLHYVLSATGTADLYAEILLGHGMQLLHETPFLRGSEITSALSATATAAGTAQLKTLYESVQMGDQIESVRITQSAPDDDEIGKVWPAFSASLRMSAFYQVSLVLLEQSYDFTPGPPVRDYAIDLQTLRRPNINRIVPQPGASSAPLMPGVPISAGSRVSLLGSGLASSDMRVMIGDQEADLTGDVTLGAQQLSLLVPADLMPGLKLVTVEHLKARNGAEPLVLERSNAHQMLVIPEVSAAAISQMAALPDGAASGKITLTVDNMLAPGSNAWLYLTPTDDTKAPQAVKWEGSETATSSIVFDVSSLAEGEVTWVLSVDGAETAADTLDFEVP